MKKMKIILITTAMVFATFVITVAAESLIIESEQKNVNNATQNTNFEAQITIFVYEGEGCSCEPIAGAYVNATGSEGPVFNITDDDGKCVLNLVIFSEYRVSIEAQNFNTVKFNFDVIDDQTFKFHMGEANEDSTQYLVQTQQIIKTLRQFLRLIEGINNIVN